MSKSSQRKWHVIPAFQVAPGSSQSCGTVSSVPTVRSLPRVSGGRPHQFSMVGAVALLLLQCASLAAPGRAAADATPPPSPLGSAQTTTTSLTVSPAPSPTPNPLAASSADTVAKAMSDVLDDPRLAIQVLVTPERKLIAYVTGTVTLDELEELNKPSYAKRIEALFAPSLVSQVVCEFNDGVPVMPNSVPTSEDPPPSLKSARETAVKKDRRDKNLTIASTEVWPLTFTQTGLKSSAVNGSESSDSNPLFDVPSLVDTLNAIYSPGADASKKAVKLTRNALTITAPQHQIIDIKRQLVLLDTPRPQVQLDLYSIQLAGQGALTPEKLQKLETRVAQAQGGIHILPNLLHQAIVQQYLHPKPMRIPGIKADSKPGIDSRYGEFELWDVCDSEMRRIQARLLDLGFDTNPARPLSLTETLIFLTLPSATDRQGMRKSLEKQALSNGFTKREKTTTQAEYSPFQMLLQAYGMKPGGPAVSEPVEEAVHSDRTALENFLRALQEYQALGKLGRNDQIKTLWGLKDEELGKMAAVLCQQEIRSSTPDSKLLTDLAPLAALARQAMHYGDDAYSNDENDGLKPLEQQPEWETREAAIHRMLTRLRTRILYSPGEVRRQSAAMDTVLKVCVDALSEDMQQMCITPLVHELNTILGQKGANSGVGLVGSSRLVVTSGLSSSLEPTLTSSVETTPVPTLDTQGLKDLKASGLDALISGASGDQLLLLSALLKQPTPSYTQVAPGVSVSVRPTVMPNGGSARLQIDASFGVTTSALSGASGGKTSTDPLARPLADAVQSHHIRTDSSISTFDLFKISAFDLTTTHPRPPSYVPILGTLPLIGRAFQWPRKDAQIKHSSILLVNTVILPRALDIARFYQY